MDRRALALSEIAGWTSSWELDSDNSLDVLSDVLDANSPSDVAALLPEAGGAGRVELNGTVVKDWEPDA